MAGAMSRNFTAPDESLHVEHSDGTAIDVEPGTAYLIEPGHNAWVTSDDVAVMYEFESAAAETYAKAPA